jgi:hypothetical protein
MRCTSLPRMLSTASTATNRPVATPLATSIARYRPSAGTYAAPTGSTSVNPIINRTPAEQSGARPTQVKPAPAPQAPARNCVVHRPAWDETVVTPKHSEMVNHPAVTSQRIIRHVQYTFDDDIVTNSMEENEAYILLILLFRSVTRPTTLRKPSQLLQHGQKRSLIGKLGLRPSSIPRLTPRRRCDSRWVGNGSRTGLDRADSVTDRAARTETVIDPPPRMDGA